MIWTYYSYSFNCWTCVACIPGNIALSWSMPRCAVTACLYECEGLTAVLQHSLRPIDAVRGSPRARSDSSYRGLARYWVQPLAHTWALLWRRTHVGSLRTQIKMRGKERVEQGCFKEGLWTLVHHWLIKIHTHPHCIGLVCGLADVPLCSMARRLSRRDLRVGSLIPRHCITKQHDTHLINPPLSVFF